MAYKLGVRHIWIENHRGEHGEKKKRLKTRIKLLLRVLGIIISALGFLYQTSQLFTVYLSGKTRVDNRVESLVFSELPAITICLPTFISMERFAENLLNNSSHKQLYEEYHDFRRKFKTWDKSAIETQKSIYKKFLDNFYSINISIVDIFEMASVQDLNMTIFATMVITKNGVLKELKAPISFESIVPFSDPRKCFTLFSQLDRHYHHGKNFKLIKLEMRFVYDLHAFPLSEFENGDFHIAVHSGNSLPKYIREESFVNLKMSKVNVISYHEIRSRLLQPPYDTNCKWYNLESPWLDMRSDCVQKCIDHKMTKLYPNTSCIYTSQNFKLIRKDNLDEELGNLELCDHFKFNRQFKNYLVREQIMLEHRCESQCQRNCREMYYSFTIDVIKVHSNIEHDNEFGILLQHNRFPDQVIDYKPIMSWIELMSNFGGLLGMWLGLSVAFIFDYFITFI